MHQKFQKNISKILKKSSEYVHWNLKTYEFYSKIFKNEDFKMNSCHFGQKIQKIQWTPFYLTWIYKKGQCPKEATVTLIWIFLEFL